MDQDNSNDDAFNVLSFQVQLRIVDHTQMHTNMWIFNLSSLNKIKQKIFFKLMIKNDNSTKVWGKLRNFLLKKAKYLPNLSP